MAQKELSPKEQGEKVEKAFEGKLPETMLEKHGKLEQLKVVNLLNDFCEKRRFLAVSQKHEARRFSGHEDYEFYSGKESAFTEIQDQLRRLKESLEK